MKACLPRSSAGDPPPLSFPVPPRDALHNALTNDRARGPDAFGATAPVIPIPVPRPWRQGLIASRRGYDHSWIGALAVAALVVISAAAPLRAASVPPQGMAVTLSDAGDGAGITAPARDAADSFSLSSGD